MNKEAKAQMVKCLQNLAAGVNKIASLHTAEKAKTASAPKQPAVDPATQKLSQAVAQKLASLYQPVGASEQAMSQALTSHAGALDLLDKVLDSVQSNKTAAAASVNSPVSGLGQAANPATANINNGADRPKKPFRQRRL